MKEIRYVITDEIGFHARPAGLLVKTVNGFDSNITIKKGTMESNAKSIIGIMALGIKNGEEVTFVIEGSDEAEASATVENFLKENL
jgi:phosphocarrier protein